MEKRIFILLVLSFFVFVFFFVNVDVLAKEKIEKKDIDTFQPRADRKELRDDLSWEGHLDQSQRRFSSSSNSNIDQIPSTIKVALTEYIGCQSWVDDGQPVVRVETIDFKEYVKNVLPNEWISSWEMEALRSGAIAAKNYGWRKINVGARNYLKDMHNLSDYPDVVDNTCDQVYLPDTKNSRTDQAIEDTWNYRLVRNNNLLVNFYLATGEQCNNSPYQPCLSQWESQYRAQEGKNWREIVHQYYDPVEISVVPGVDSNPISVATPVPTVPYGVYRFWSDKKKGHFYTASAVERDSVINDYDDSVWRYEGIAYLFAKSESIAKYPVYRFWSDKYQGHFYTISTSEKEHIERSYPDNVWRYEGNAFYVHNEKISNKTQPVYRFWSDTYFHHFYTASATEKNSIISNYDDKIWRYEGIAWYVPID
jgi:hypothetical protein